MALIQFFLWVHDGTDVETTSNSNLFININDYVVYEWKRLTEQSYAYRLKSPIVLTEPSSVTGLYRTAA